jgi:hypothetical protein
MMQYGSMLLISFLLSQGCVSFKGSSTTVYVAANRDAARPRHDSKPSRETNRSPGVSFRQGAREQVQANDPTLSPYVRSSWVTQLRPGLIGFEIDGYTRPTTMPLDTLGGLKLLGQLVTESVSSYPKAVHNLRDGSWSAGVGYGLASIAEASVTGVVWPPDRFGNLRLSIKAFNTGPQVEINSRLLIRDTIQEASDILRTEFNDTLPLSTNCPDRYITACR